MGRRPSIEKQITEDITKRVKASNKLAAVDIAKDIKKIHNNAVRSWYNSYRPREYERQYRLYSDAVINNRDRLTTENSVVADIRVASRNIVGAPYTNWKGHRVGRDIIFGITEIDGKHGCRGGSADTSPKALTEKKMDEYKAKGMIEKRILDRLRGGFK